MRSVHTARSTHPYGSASPDSTALAGTSSGSYLASCGIHASTFLASFAPPAFAGFRATTTPLSPACPTCVGAEACRHPQSTHVTFQTSRRQPPHDHRAPLHRLPIVMRAVTPSGVGFACTRQLAWSCGRITFVLLRAIRSPPPALHVASRLRSRVRIPGRRASARVGTRTPPMSCADGRTGAGVSPGVPAPRSCANARARSEAVEEARRSPAAAHPQARGGEGALRFGSECGRSAAPSELERPRHSLASAPGPLPSSPQRAGAQCGPQRECRPDRSGRRGLRRRGPSSKSRSAASTARAARRSCACAPVATGGRSPAGRTAGRCGARSPCAPRGIATSAACAAGIGTPPASVVIASARRRK